MYTIIAENDESKWKDKTGELYHFPSRYLKFLEPGTNVIYYKGRLVDKKYTEFRLSNEPHYFGCGRIGTVTKDPNSPKNDYYAAIEDFQQFAIPVNFKEGGNPIEQIPLSRANNYWRDGVRITNQEVYEKIKSKAGINLNNESKFNDLNIESPSLDSEFFEGGQKQRYSTYYERNPQAREQAVLIHGYSCMACGFNFKEKYGEWGMGYIHVHHIKPISTTEQKSKIDPVNDFVVLCANCHAMVHRRKDKVLNLLELKELITTNKK